MIHLMSLKMFKFEDFLFKHESYLAEFIQKYTKYLSAKQY